MSGRSAKAIADAELSLDSRLDGYARQLYPALAGLIKGGPDRPVLLSVTFRPRDTGWLAIARAHTLPEFHPVVLFASGETLTLTLRNLNLAISKKAWKADRYAK